MRLTNLGSWLSWERRVVSCDPPDHGCCHHPRWCHWNHHLLKVSRSKWCLLNTGLDAREWASGALCRKEESRNLGLQRRKTPSQPGGEDSAMPVVLAYELAVTHLTWSNFGFSVLGVNPGPGVCWGDALPLHYTPSLTYIFQLDENNLNLNEDKYMKWESIKTKP